VNPGPAYIEDIAGVFNDNGEGIRGDLKAVIKAILLHEEARTCLWQEDPANGKLKSPVGRYIQFARNFAYSGDHYWTSGFTFENNTSQLPLSSPSVFNFYLPDHQPNGPIYDQDLHAPEFEIHNSVTSLGFANEVDIWVRQERVFSAVDLNYTAELKIDHLLEAARNPRELVNELDILLCHGRLSRENAEIIINALGDFNFGNTVLLNRLQIALYLIMISPDFNIQK
jgi:uncharacterized protein (DUF1800 family)